MSECKEGQMWRQPTLKVFQIVLSNRYQVLTDLEDEDKSQSIGEGKS